MRRAVPPYACYDFCKTQSPTPDQRRAPHAGPNVSWMGVFGAPRDAVKRRLARKRNQIGFAAGGFKFTW